MAGLNETIDDADPRVTYFDSTWNDQTCPQKPCGARLSDPSQAYAGTWHEDTRADNGTQLSVSVVFNGTGIAAYAILPGTNESLAYKNLNLLVSIDGGTPNATHMVPTETDIQVNVQIFAIDGLESGREHTLAIVLEPSTFLMIDYFNVTHDDFVTHDSSPSNDISGGEIAGIVIAVITFLLVVLLGIYLWRKWRRSRPTADQPDDTQMMVEPWHDPSPLAAGHSRHISVDPSDSPSSSAGMPRSVPPSSIRSRKQLPPVPLANNYAPQIHVDSGIRYEQVVSIPPRPRSEVPPVYSPN